MHDKWLKVSLGLIAMTAILLPISAAAWIALALIGF